MKNTWGYCTGFSCSVHRFISALYNAFITTYEKKFTFYIQSVQNITLIRLTDLFYKCKYLGLQMFYSKSGKRTNFNVLIYRIFMYM